MDSQVPESCWGMLERVRIELPGGGGVAELDVALVYVPRLSRAHKLIPILKMAPAGVPGHLTGKSMSIPEGHSRWRQQPTTRKGWRLA